MDHKLLCGRRVLIVEDEYFLADDLAHALTGAGALVVGPAPSLAAAFQLLETGPPPAVATIDINLRGEKAYPLADALMRRAIPFLFTTGYDGTSMPARLAAIPRLEKPVESRTVLRELGRLLTA